MAENSSDARDAGSLALWLADHADASLPDLHDGFSRDLLGLGLPLWRSSLGLELLHPEQSGIRSVWSADGPVSVTQAPRGVNTTPDYLNSPVRIIDQTGKPFRHRLDGELPDLPLLKELRDAGGTDYIIFPLPFLDRLRSAYLSFTARGPSGFSDSDIPLLEVSARLLSPYIERRALRRMAIDLLDTYVGHHAGERIFQGQILRGAVDTIEAAILMGDLRGFTVMSKSREQAVVIETLNAWFDTLSLAIEANGGEILKFMGDGLLAIFRAETSISQSCQEAFSAATDAQSAIAGLNTEREVVGAPPINFVMGLHVGEVAYGNVGGRTRLDFTVLGPAVNYASRLQDLAKRLNQPILVSRAFAEALPSGAIDLGTHTLRGIGKSERVFALPAAA